MSELTLRDEFVIAALHRVTKRAYVLADAMMLERNGGVL